MNPQKELLWGLGVLLNYGVLGGSGYLFRTRFSTSHVGVRAWPVSIQGFRFMPSKIISGPGGGVPISLSGADLCRPSLTSLAQTASLSAQSTARFIAGNT